MKIQLQTGDFIRFYGERTGYTVQAANDRFVLATKPFPLRKTYFYTILDLKAGRRGPVDLIFGLENDVNDPHKAQYLIDGMRLNALVAEQRTKETGVIHEVECPQVSRRHGTNFQIREIRMVPRKIWYEPARNYYGEEVPDEPKQEVPQSFS